MLSRGPRRGQGGPGVGLARSSLLSARRLWTPRATPYPEDTLRSPPWWVPTCTPRAHPGPPRCPQAGRAGRSSGREGAAPSWPPGPAEHPARGRPRGGPRGPVVVPVPRCLRPRDPPVSRAAPGPAWPCRPHGSRPPSPSCPAALSSRLGEPASAPVGLCGAFLLDSGHSCSHLRSALSGGVTRTAAVWALRGRVPRVLAGPLPTSAAARMLPCAQGAASREL